VQRHRLYSGTEPRVCEGSGKPAVPFDPGKCGGCLEYQLMTPGLYEACASVGIEHGKDAGVMLHEVLAAYHRNGHRDLSGTRHAASPLDSGPGDRAP
jgi:hypothetical protein